MQITTITLCKLDRYMVGLFSMQEDYEFSICWGQKPDILEISMSTKRLTEMWRKAYFILGVEILWEVYIHLSFQQLLEIASLREGMHPNFAEEELLNQNCVKQKHTHPNFTCQIFLPFLRSNVGNYYKIGHACFLPKLFKKVQRYVFPTSLDAKQPDIHRQ